MKNIIINTLIFLITLEVSSYIALVVLDENAVDYEQMYYGGNKNIFVRGKCKVHERLKPHPHLGFINNPECVKVNNVGLLGVNVNFKKKENNIRIGIFGGSVAAGFAGIDGISSLQHYLNQCFSDNGKLNYKINNFSDGAWKYPHQVIALSLYKELIDIAISIEGFNEQFMYSEKPKYDFSIPSDSYIYTFKGSKRYYLLKMYSFFHFNNEEFVTNINTLRIMVLLLRKSIEYIFENWFNDDWKKIWQLPYNIEQLQWNINRHSGFLRDFESIASASNIPAIFVLQPTPIYKEILTDQELEVITYKDYHNQYEKIAEVMGDNVSRFLDLSKIFLKERKTVFVDSIHFASSDDSYSLGNIKMAEMIADYMRAENILKFDNECNMKNFW